MSLAQKDNGLHDPSVLVLPLASEQLIRHDPVSSEIAQCISSLIAEAA